MAQKVQLKAEGRSGRRKGAARALRRTGKVPAIIYGHGREPETLAVDGVELERLLERIEPESTLIELTVDGKRTNALIREVQRHPLRTGVNAFLHVDFQEVHADEKIRLEVPVHLVGSPEGVRNQGGVLDQVLRTVLIEVLPADIPERVELDVTALTIGKSLHVSDLVIPKAQILSDPSLTVATVVAPKVEEEPVAAAAATVEPTVEEPEVIKKGKTEEEPAAEE
ncbi:MAG TPA: 50S ribosomal protein L25 [Gemmatimonadales bacterium]|nr:50S ribosomal protein L25 [Gemmatimonadales bacterium]